MTREHLYNRAQLFMSSGWSGVDIRCSEGGYGINTQVEKSKNMTIVKFMEINLNKLF